MDRVKEDVRADDMVEALQSALAGVPNGDFAAAAQDLLTALGYRSARTLLGQTGDVADFIAQFPAEKSCTVSEQTFRDNAQSVRIIFQVTGEEVATATQRTLFDADDFDSGNAHSFLFVAVELKGEQYPRGQYAQFTREINKRFPMPSVVLFRTTTDHLPAETSAQAGLLTLAFVHRREHKRDKQRDVLGKVSLIREIDPANPHRGHLDILRELSLESRLRWMNAHHRLTNFDGLLAAWLVALDTEELNKRFYRDLFTWFEKRAVSEATFPENEAKSLPAEEHVIRLITRLLFVWFIKEKGLIAPELFNEAQVAGLLRDYDRDSGDSYYRAVLQNLFFATLNTEIDRRDFSKESNTSHRDFSLYRYKSEIRDPDALLALFARTPFINGGLFDCLDSDEASRHGGYRIDCFTDNPNQRKEYSIPNRLFFDASSTNPGLITLFKRYKFTVEENTPIEQEVALDPELLGKVFENLLAAYNPETRETARKRTGSYYTPRVVVDYMVEEALKRYLEQKVEKVEKVEQTFLSAHKHQTETLSSLSTTRCHLPHWEKDGSIYWITFRLADAIPQDKLRAWQEERDLWLKHHPEPWSDAEWNEYNQRFGEKIEAWLDAGMGSRALARPDAREAVRNCLLRFDGERLRLHAAVIMPTHVHFLMEPLRGHHLSRILQGIKGASAREINKLLGVTGTFWLDESYDHIVRSEKQYWRFIRYIAGNPTKAGLRDHEYWLYQGGAKSGADIPVCELKENQRNEEQREGQTEMSAPPSRALPQRLDCLLSYTGEPPNFTEAETDALIHAIAEVKVLDPAVGSGAFPMGILHKLTLALRRIDPNNERWEALQKERAGAKADAAFETKDQQERDAELLEISEIFERYSGDFGRKLYLIQNSIFGVDIQPVACQIAKLRFFISLAIEQEADEMAENFGIKPLPNLETRFVAANTLLLLRQTDQMSLGEIDAVKRLERELNANRERHFHATTRQKKLACRKEDKTLRRKLATELENLGFPADTARKIAEWDPYDQNTGTDWFDAQYMFYVAGGFDVVISNPPYIQLQKEGGRLGRLYKGAGYSTFARTGDIYQLFCERGCQLLKRASGLLAYITSNSWLKAQYGKALRRYFAERHTPLRLLELGKDVFENTIVDTSVLLLREGGCGKPFPAVDMDKLAARDFPPHESLWGQARPDGEKPWSILSHAARRVMDKIQAKGTLLKEWDIAINYGIKTGYNNAFIIDNDTKKALIAEDANSAGIIKQILRGCDIKRYQAEWGKLWLIATFPALAVNIDNYPAVKRHLLSFGKARLEQSGRTLPNGTKSRKKTIHAWYE